MAVVVHLLRVERQVAVGVDGVGVGKHTAIHLGLAPRLCHDRRVDGHAAMLWSVGGYALRREVRAEYWDQCAGNRRAECRADGFGTRVGHPVAYEELINDCWV